MSGQRPGLAAAAALCVLALSGVATRAQLQVPDVKSNRPTPRMANGKPDLSGYWKGTTDTKPVGNIGKDLPGWKLPLTPAGEAALKHNLTATIDPESLCIIGGIPRHNASGLPFEVLQGTNKIAFFTGTATTGSFRSMRTASTPTIPIHRSSARSLAGGKATRWSSIRSASKRRRSGSTRTPIRIAMRCMSSSGGPGPMPTTFMSKRSSKIRSSTRSRSRTRARGSWANQMRRFRSTRAARTTSMRLTWASAPGRFVPTAHAATSIRRRCSRRFRALENDTTLFFVPLEIFVSFAIFVSFVCVTIRPLCV